MTQSALYQVGNTPFTIDVLSAIYPECRQITDKVRRLERDGSIIRLKRGLYVRSAENGATPVPWVMANHIYGPSYVSSLSALRYQGLIPERVHEIISMTLKRSRSYQNPFGLFSYHTCPPAYFPIGISMCREADVQFLMASPEKALCDLMTITRGLSFHNSQELADYLEEDLRFDMEVLPTFSIPLLEQCLNTATVKPQNINALIQLLQ